MGTKIGCARDAVLWYTFARIENFMSQLMRTIRRFYNREFDATICPVSGETGAEERVNFLTHAIGLLFSIVGGGFLITSTLSTGDFWTIFSSIVYAATLILMYVSSTLYHGSSTPHRKQRLRILDHSCIYLLIAGSYTPFIFGVLEGSVSWIIGVVVWTAAIAGVIVKIFYTGRFVVFSTLLYLAMGWQVIIVADTLLGSLPFEGFAWLIAGGLSYTIGVLFFLRESMPYNHSIWHLFVLGGSACHYCSITFYVLL